MRRWTPTSFIPPGVPHDIANASDEPARMIMTVSPPGHEHYFEELVNIETPRPDRGITARHATAQRRGGRAGGGHGGVTMQARLARLFAAEVGLSLSPLPVELNEVTISLLWHASYDHDPAHIWLRELVTQLAADL